jgi:hypothetical protein
MMFYTKFGFTTTGIFVFLSASNLVIAAEVADAAECISAKNCDSCIQLPNCYWCNDPVIEQTTFLLN